MATGLGATLDEELLDEDTDDSAEPAMAVAPAWLTPVVPVCATLSPDVDPEQAAVAASTLTAIRASAARRAGFER